MDGMTLFKNLPERDYSGSEEDEYIQFIQTLFLHLRYDLFPFLEKAHVQGKKLSLKKGSEYHDEITIGDIILI